MQLRWRCGHETTSPPPPPPLLLCSCSSLKYSGRLEYTGQHGTYSAEYDGKRVTGVVRFFNENGYNIDPTYRRQK